MDHIKFHDQEREPFSLKVKAERSRDLRDNDYKTASRLVNTLAGKQR